VLQLVGQKKKKKSPFHTLDDLRAVVQKTERQNLVADALVRKMFEIHDCAVREVMTPRSQVVGLARAASLQEAVQVARESGYSRFPVYDGTLDDVQGLVHARDLYEAALRGDVSGIGSLVRPGLVVPETKKASELLAEIRRAGIHMVMVVDEHGSIVGLATLEDVFEIIVGDIGDEHETPLERVRALGKGILDVDAFFAVRELNAGQDLVLPESEGYVTLAGLILDRLGTIPRGGEQVEAPPPSDGRRRRRAAHHPRPHREGDHERPYGRLKPHPRPPATRPP
jgi:CBS domain containing-hemolysin-like protein